MFDSVVDAYDSSVYIDNRSYVVNGVLAEVGTVASGISPDEAIFIPYETGIKYVVKELPVLKTGEIGHGSNSKAILIGEELKKW